MNGSFGGKNSGFLFTEALYRIRSDCMAAIWFDKSPDGRRVGLLLALIFLISVKYFVQNILFDFMRGKRQYNLKLLALHP